jgi:hypothetical protein
LFNSKFKINVEIKKIDTPKKIDTSKKVDILFNLDPLEERYDPSFFALSEGVYHYREKYAGYGIIFNVVSDNVDFVSSLDIFEKIEGKVVFSDFYESSDLGMDGVIALSNNEILSGIDDVFRSEEIKREVEDPMVFMLDNPYVDPRMFKNIFGIEASSIHAHEEEAEEIKKQLVPEDIVIVVPYVDPKDLCEGNFTDSECYYNHISEIDKWLYDDYFRNVVFVDFSQGLYYRDYCNFLFKSKLFELVKLKRKNEFVPIKSFSDVGEDIDFEDEGLNLIWEEYKFRLYDAGLSEYI